MIDLSTIRVNPFVSIVPFHPTHLSKFKLKPFELEYYRVMPNYFEYIAQMADSRMSWTVVGRGRPVCCFGLWQLWDGVAEAWMLPDEEIDKYAISVTRGARRVLAKAIQDIGIKRLQIAVRVQNDTAYKFAEALYFKTECVMKHYGPEGADYYLMARY